MARHTRHFITGRWIGTVEDVARIGRVARGAFQHPDDFAITIKMLPGVEHEYPSVEEFQEAAHDLDLSAITNLHIFGQQTAVEPLQRISGYYSRRPTAATFSVEGSDEQWVEGVAAQLVRAVETAERWPLRWGVWAVGFGLSAVIVAASTALASFVTGSLPWWVYVLTGTLCAGLLVCAAALIGRLRRLLPPFAIVQDGYTSPARKLLNATPGIVKALVLIVATALIIGGSPSRKAGRNC